MTGKGVEAMTQGASVRVATRTALVADIDADRAEVVAALIERMGFIVIRLVAVWEIIEALNELPSVPCLVASSYKLSDGLLIPALKRRYRQDGHPLPRLLLWAPNGLFDMWQHKRFLENQFAVPFQYPVDLDAVLAIVRMYAVLDGLRG